MVNLERHHATFPLSLNGYDWDENIMIVTKEEHKVIHGHLNIPHEQLRKFRKETNHMCLNPGSAYVYALIKLQNMYIDRLKYLPPHLIRGHVTCIREVCLRQRREKGIKIIMPDDFNGMLSEFTYWKKMFHDDCIMLIKHKR